MKKVPLIEAINVAESHAQQTYIQLKQHNYGLADITLRDLLAQLAHIRDGISRGAFDGV